MSKLFINMKMKFKLILICSIPFFVVSIFLGKVIWEDFHVIKEIEEDLEIVRIYDEAGIVIRQLGEEETVSFLVHRKVEGFDRSLLMIERNKSDEASKRLTADLQASAVSIHNRTLEDIFRGFLEKANQINDIRKQIDTRSLSLDETAAFFQEVKNRGMHNLEEISKSFSDLTFARSMFAYIALLHERNSANVSRRLMVEMFAKDDFQASNFMILLQSIGQEKAFETIFHELATPAQEEMYVKTTQTQGIAELEKIQQSLLTNAGKENLNYNPSKIWELQSKKREALQSALDNLAAESKVYLAGVRTGKLFELYAILISIIVSLAIAAVLVIFSLKGIVKRLQEEIVILSTSGNEIKTSITEASAGTSETAASVTETTTTVEELKQTAQVAAEKAKKVAEDSNEAITILNTGERNLEKTIEGMMHIQNGMSTISESIIKLSEHSQSIGKIIDTVNELAEQSHLLAVNAAIEAAKAGEQGKGFSVVAQEVRSLAEQSKQATVQVRGILNDIQNATSAAVMATEQGTKAVNNGVEMSNQIGVSIQSLSEGINKVSEASSQIALSSEQQLIGVSQVNVAMTNIREATEKHVEHMHLIENAIEGMNAVGHSLKHLVTKF